VNLHLFKLLLFEVLTRCLLADHSFKKVRVHLSADELQMCDGGLPLSGHYITSQVSRQSTLRNVFIQNNNQLTA